MRSVILNMMIMGAVGCLIKPDVTAKKYDYTDAWIQYVNQKSGNQTVTNDTIGNDLDKSADKIPYRTKNVKNVATSTKNYDYTNAWIQFLNQKSGDRTVTDDTVGNDLDRSIDKIPYRTKANNVDKSTKQSLEQRRDSGVDAGDFTASKSGADIPPPPPPPTGIGGIPLPPPLPGIAGAITMATIDSAEFTNEIRSFWQTFLENNRVGLFRKIINTYLRANKLKISEAISEGEKHAKKLVVRVDVCSKNLKEYLSNLSKLKENEEKKEFCSSLFYLLKSLTIYVEKLTLTEYKKENDKITNFANYKNMIEGIFSEYLEKCKETVELWKNDPILTILQEIQAIMVGALILSDSCYDLVKLSAQEGVPVSEIQMKNIVSIFRLRDLTLKRLDAIKEAEKQVEEQNNARNAVIEEKKARGEKYDDKSSYIPEMPKSVKSEIFLPTGNSISEQEFLNQVLDYVEGIFEGETNNLQKLLDLKYLLNDENTAFKTNVNSICDPLGNIRSLDANMLDVKSIFEQAINDFETSSYSQFTNLFKSSGSNYEGGGLSPSVVEFTKSANLQIFENDNLQSLRLKFGAKKIKGDIISEYMKLLPLLFSDLEGFLRKYAIGDTNTTSLINRSEEKFFPSTFKVKTETRSNKQNRKKEEVLLVFGNKKGNEFEERELDPTESILSYSTIKILKSEVDKLLELEQDIKRTPEVIEKIHSIFGEKGGDSVGYIDRCLNRYLKFDLSFETSDGRIMIDLPPQKDKNGNETRKLSSDYIPNLLYAFAQNRDLVEKSNMFMFSASKDLDGDRRSILNIIADFADRLHDVIEAMQTQNKNGELDELIEKVQKLLSSINEKKSFKPQASKIKTSQKATKEGLIKSVVDFQQQNIRTSQNNLLKSKENKIKNAQKITNRREN